ncbi:hypothetical protein OZX74_08845 [Bifidobacterium sp. ESL0798]|uniref:hypothetical protein n=1 Tax=Bifidobacterium sp. ESL0798 TaxID=2983235 RepID=UPI0023F8258F|nr:hypothetical protein [Bifidobacterium sp. ESL0798]WEV73968.1 hypothetical protein OZX74_08845 [Bifidobacterium sp. ESL0798]
MNNAKKATKSLKKAMVSAAALVAGVAMLAPGTAQASQTNSGCVTDQSSIVQCFHDWSLAWAVAGQTHSSINDVFTSAMADSVTNVKANAVSIPWRVCRICRICVH